MDARFVRWRRRVLVSRPRHQALGLLVADVLVSLYVARSSGTPLLVLKGSDEEDSPLLRLRCDEVAWVNPNTWKGRAIARTFVVLLWAGRVGYAVANPRNPAITGIQAVFWLLHRPVYLLAHAVVESRRVGREVWNESIRAVQRWSDRVALAAGRWVGARQQTGRLRTVAPGKELAGRWRVSIARLDGLLVGKRPKPPINIRDRVALAGRAFDTWLEGCRVALPGRPQVHVGYDIRELSYSQPLHVRLAPEDERAAARVAADLGIPADGRLVVLHVRESSTKAAAGVDDRSKDTARNARIETFFPAIDEIVAHGCTVVRIGDPSMTPIERPGVVDLATDPRRTQAVELWCLARCHFFVAADSGPYLLSWLLDVPCLSVNITNTLGVFPLRAHDRYLIKRVRDATTGQMVPLAEMLQENFLYSMRRRMFKLDEIEYVDNTPEEILAGVREMFDAVEGRAPAETDVQRRYAALIAEARQGALSRAKTQEKTGSAEVFLGAGRVVDAFAAGHLDV